MFRILILVAFLVMSTTSYPLAPEYAEGLRRNLQTIIDRHPSYRWGGSKEESNGLDCSGYIYLAAKRTGLPVQRTTALNMRLGRAGWVGIDSDIDHESELDLVFWTWKGQEFRRPHGHVGIFMKHPGYQKLWVTHSCQSRGVTEQEVKGPLFDDISAIRELTIGDPMKLGSGIKQIK